MKSSTSILVGSLLLFLSAQQLPAPILEENPTPAPEPSAKPKAKRVIEPKRERTATPSRAAPTPTPAPSKKFAGTWSGIMPEVPWGNVPTELIVNEDETTMEWRESGKSKAGITKANLNGGTLSARFPIGFTTAVWFVSPHADGITADIRMTAFMNDDQPVFRRTSP